MRHKLFVLACIVILAIGACGDDANETVTGAANKTLRFLIFDTASDSVKPEPIATAISKPPRQTCIYMGLEVECK